jgi:hypothetical protein
MARNPMILTAFFNPQGDQRMSRRDPNAPRMLIKAGPSQIGSAAAGDRSHSPE